jgi:hypothetical protein
MGCRVILEDSQSIRLSREVILRRRRGHLICRPDVVPAPAKAFVSLSQTPDVLRNCAFASRIEAFTPGAG